jgi:2-hydroxycyclohexanecarboxyl-CoA dehydrogenase
LDLGLKGKNVVVTGGGTNIGRSIVLAFAAEGSNVVIAELNKAAGAAVATEVEALGAGGSAIVIDADVTDKDKTDSTMADAIAQLGSIDVLVNNVGWTIDRLFLEKSREEHVREVDINLWGAVNCIHAVLPHMIERQTGSIVSISSDAGRMGEYREAVYSACKAGVIALSKSIARETGRYGIRLNMVCPGLVVPPQSEVNNPDSMWSQGMQDIFTEDVLERVRRAYPLRRMGTAQEVANAVVFLASDAASFITGQTLSVSGGYTMM